MKLTDTRLKLLAAAAQREDHAVVMPDNLKGGAAQKVVDRLLAAGLVEEIAAAGQWPVWRRDHGGTAFALRIAAGGLAVIRVMADAAIADIPAAAATKAAARRAKTAASPLPSTVTNKGAERPVAGDLRPPREGTKLATVIALLAGANGATIEALIAATHWLPHTTRAALTGLRKRGYRLDRQRNKHRGRSVYRLSRMSAEARKQRRPRQLRAPG